MLESAYMGRQFENRPDLEKKGEIVSQIYHNLPEGLSEEDINRLKNIVSEFATGFRILMDKGPYVTVFGSSRINTASSEYRMGMELGEKLAKIGYSVLTGGGPGVMEAVNRGAHEANGHSAGINIFLPEEQRANPYIEPAITMNYFFVRKVLLLKYSTAFIFMPGGFGTLDELFETVTLVQTKKIAPFPVILVGREFWNGLLEWIRKKLEDEKLIGPGDMQCLYLADTVPEIIQIMTEKAPLYEHHG